MYDILGYLFVFVILLSFAGYFIRDGVITYKVNRTLKNKGDIIKGIVDSFYIQNNIDTKDKMPRIKYMEPESGTIKYFDSILDKGKLLDTYEIGDEVELLYYKKKNETLVKINDNKQFYNDTISAFILGSFFILLSFIAVSFLF